MAMGYSPKVVLHCPDGTPADLLPLLHQFIADGVKYVGVVGPTCEDIETLMDDLAIAHGSPDKNFVLTASHRDEDLDDAIALAELITIAPQSQVQVVEVLGGAHG